MGGASLQESARTSRDERRGAAQKGKTAPLSSLSATIASSMHGTRTIRHSFGVCCLFVIDTSEGGAVSQNGTYLQNPDFPSATSFGGEYAYRVEKCDYGGDICSVRLDFETFTVAGTGVTDETAGCDRDRLTVEVNIL